MANIHPILGTGDHSEFYQLKANETISDRFKLLNIPCCLDTVVRHKILNVRISAKWGPQYFKDLYREHIWSEIIRNVLEVRIILEEILGPFIDMTGCESLTQDHSLTHIVVKVSV